jgi:hypothetical protein
MSENAPENLAPLDKLRGTEGGEASRKGRMCVFIKKGLRYRQASRHARQATKTS